MTDAATPRPVLVVDFGAQYAQLIARRVREAQMYSEVIAHDAPIAQFREKNPVALVLTGGPSSVYADGAPSLQPELLELGVPVFGICYGFQAMTHALGGTVAQTGKRVRPYGFDACRRLRCAARGLGTDSQGVDVAW